MLLVAFPKAEGRMVVTPLASLSVFQTWRDELQWEPSTVRSGRWEWLQEKRALGGGVHHPRRLLKRNRLWAGRGEDLRGAGARDGVRKQVGSNVCSKS